jgi:predicted metal-dependent peptidase
MSKDLQNLISASLLRLRMKSPFFATLALFARFVPSQQTPYAATDGKDIYYLRSLPPTQQDGLLLHEVLHAALMHVLRRGVRDAELWNIAADIVVNGIILQQGVFDLPPGGLRVPKLEHLSVEEIYELLLKKTVPRPKLPNPDLLSCSLADRLSSQAEGEVTQIQKASLEAHWQNALQQASVIARTTSQGKLPAGIDRELGLLTTPQLDWRAYLWRYLVQTPTDFMGFDRRFVGRGLYLEALVGESVKVFVAVDTSGSIDTEELRMFLSEVGGILGSYPHLQCELYYADAEAYGPHELNPDSTIPKPQGGGGTSFIPFFEKVYQRWDRQTQGVCIYLTDGYGDFPERSPELPVLWVVTPGGLDLSEFPFGEAVRLLTK